MRALWGMLLVVSVVVASPATLSAQTAEELGLGFQQAARQIALDADVFLEAKNCNCQATCKVAVNQIVTDEFARRMFTRVADAVIQGGLTWLEGAGVRRGVITAIRRLWERLKEVEGSFQFGDEHGTEQIEAAFRGIAVEKTCEVKWFGLYNPRNRKVRVYTTCQCNGSVCALEYSYGARANGRPLTSVGVRAPRGQ